MNPTDPDQPSDHHLLAASPLPLSNALKLATLEGRVNQVQRELEILSSATKDEITALKHTIDQLSRTTTRHTVALSILITAANGASFAMQTHLLGSWP